MALCPACKTECGDKAVCAKCGFAEVGKTFINREEAELWREKTLRPFTNSRRVIYDKTLFEINGSSLIHYLAVDSDIASVSIPYGIADIGAGAFANSRFTEINIPNTVKHIGREAFVGCYELQAINIPKSVISIGFSAFYMAGNEKIQSVVIPKNVTRIELYAFAGCCKSVFCEIESKPHGWDGKCGNEWVSGREIPVYWGGEWHYNENGEPVPNDK